MIVSVPDFQTIPVRCQCRWPIGHLLARDLLADDLLAHNQDRGGDEYSRSCHNQAETPENAAAREQGDRADHQRDLQTDYAEIEAVSLAAGKFAFLFQFVVL